MKTGVETKTDLERVFKCKTTVREKKIFVWSADAEKVEVEALERH